MTVVLEGRAYSIWARLFQYDLEAFRRAYEAAREASDRSRTQLERNWAELERDVAAGRKSFIEEDEEGRLIYDRGEHAGEMEAEIEGVLRIVREAFTISLHHFWERELTVRMRTARYKEAKAIEFLKGKGINPNEAGLTVLRLAANVAKHSEGNSANQLHDLRPDLFDVRQMSQYGDPPGYEYLRISDAILDEFFATVQTSGPQQEGRRLK